MCLAIICRVCHTRAKAGVLCQDCGLVCHAGCVTKEVNRCDPLEQLALYTRQRELSASADAGESTTSLGHYPLEIDSNLTALSNNIWKRSKAALERRGSTKLAPPLQRMSNTSSDSVTTAHIAKSASTSSRPSSALGKKEDGRARTRSQDVSSDDQNTVRQAASTPCSDRVAVSGGVENGPNGQTKAKDSKSDCQVM